MMDRHNQFFTVVLLLLIVSFQLSVEAKETEYYTESLTILDGLSHNRVASITRDHHGFMWFATENGINRYDGYTFERFSPNSTIELKVNCPSIEEIYSDSKQNIWIGTKSGGVNKYNLITEEFINYPYCLNDSNCLSDQRIISFCEDHDNHLWIGTWAGGINKYDYQSNTFKKYLSFPENSIMGNIGDIICTKDGSVWAAGYFGLWKYNKTRDEFEKINNTGLPFEENGYIAFVNLLEDTLRNKLWIGTWARGLIEYDLLNKQFIQHKTNESIQQVSDPFSNVYCLNMDDEGQLWIGTWGAGLWKYDIENKKYTRINIQGKKNQSNYVILDIFDDKEGNIWIGTNNAGIIRLNKKLPFKNVLFEEQVNAPIALSLTEDEHNNIFISTLQQGIFWKPKGGSIQQIHTDKDENIFESNLVYINKNKKIWVSGDNDLYEIGWKQGKPFLYSCSQLYQNNQLKINKVTSIVEMDHLIFIGTKENSLYLFSYSGGKYTLIKNFEVNASKPGYLQNDRISYLFLDNKKRVWVGTFGGLQLITDNLNIVNSKDIFESGHSLTCDIITCIYQDSKERILVSTPCGLNVLTELPSGKFSIKSYTTDDGLPEDFIYSILEDNQQQLWINTNISIVNANIDRGLFKSYFNHNGIDIKNFETGSYKNGKGELFFCGTSGYIQFDPNEINKQQYTKQLSVSSFKVLNKEIRPNVKYNNRIIFNKTINELSEITLTNKEKEFSFIITYLDFHNPDKHHYAYKLEGYDENWVNIGVRRHISFSNLKPGKYYFQARGSSNDGNWNELPHPIKITILPPWYRTWLAYIIYILSIVTIVYLIRYNAIKQMRLQRNIELLQMRNEQEHTINELKFRFFTNISHEFVTPLTLIIGPIKELFDKSDQYGFTEELKNKIKVIGKNANRLLRLINQLLDFRKTETSKMSLRAQKTNIVEFIDEICLSFSELASQNHINFQVKYNNHEKEIWCDREKLEIIINNLLSNSIKYVSERGEIKIVVDENPSHFIIRVIDNGIGIPESEIENIFERFYQIERIQNYGSAGIGLALVKRFVELHKGKIAVHSIQNEKTEFSVQLPKGENHLEPSEKSDSSVSIIKPKELFDFPQMMQKIKPAYKTSANPNIKILIVEDNSDMKDYLEDLLSAHYSVQTAVDGQDGFDKALEYQPDLIVSDIMMPNVDGFELCQKLKNNNSLKLVPIILLTAKSAENYAVFGLRAGADDYISKPFDPGLLLEKVSNILHSRKLLKENFSKKVKVSGTEIEITPFDEKLINNCIKIIEKNFLNPELDADLLAREFNMSRSSLYRKLKSITGYSINHFIRKIRLDRAVQLLEDGEKTVTEIAYEVGFNDLKYFRESFVKQFGTTPTKFRKENL